MLVVLLNQEIYGFLRDGHSADGGFWFVSILHGTWHFYSFEEILKMDLRHLPTWSIMWAHEFIFALFLDIGEDVEGDVSV